MTDGLSLSLAVPPLKIRLRNHWTRVGFSRLFPTVADYLLPFAGLSRRPFCISLRFIISGHRHVS